MSKPPGLDPNAPLLYSAQMLSAPTVHGYLPDAPALVAGFRHALVLSPGGEIEELEKPALERRIEAGMQPILCHARLTARRLETAPFPCFDVLELFAFVRPGRFVLPTPRGLAEILDLPIPTSPEKEAETLILASLALLDELATRPSPDAPGIASAMARVGWSWGGSVMASLNVGDLPHSRNLTGALSVWSKLPDWEDGPPPVPPGSQPVAAGEAKGRLREILGSAGERRDEQAAYADTCTYAFQAATRAGEPHLVLAEAGTGVGKTLGYLAPASLWAEKNEGTVWISTFTRNLQRQLDGELDRVYPDAADKADRVVIRKGRENYLCLLNFEEAVRRIPAGRGGDAVALGLMARWILATRDGDMIGGDFPAWLLGILGRNLTVDLTDTRGECIYSACAHYGKCFIEHSVRRAKTADIVVANHALVMVQAALGGEGALMPTRYVFDEGHHIFDAADSAFAADLSGRETAELRRWIVGAEEGSRSRSRGLKTRLSDLIAGDQAAEEALADLINAARALPGPAWGQRIAGGNPTGAAEAFLAMVRTQVYARDPDPNAPYDLETETTPPVPGLIDEARKLHAALTRMVRPMTVLVKSLAALMHEEAGDLETAQRNRIDALLRSIERRGLQQVGAWQSMLAALESETADGFVDWFTVERLMGRDFDVGFRRHWTDPTQPFVNAVVEPAQGVLVTSATLCDASGDAEHDWQYARLRTGAPHLAADVLCRSQPSPFDYGAQTRVFVVGDVNRNDPGAVASAYRELFRSAAGSGLGIFTAISRLRAVYERIAGPLEESGIGLYAQHIDAMDTGTLVDIFRAEEDACLLGTDSVRDGVDVPGRSLRLIVFDRVPWPRPTILHKARRQAFGGRAYDEMLTRLKLKQAYGRLIRRTGDRGVFVMLDRALPSRLLGAFPEGVEVARLGLAEAVAETRGFLAEY